MTEGALGRVVALVRHEGRDRLQNDVDRKGFVVLQRNLLDQVRRRVGVVHREGGGGGGGRAADGAAGAFRGAGDDGSLGGVLQDFLVERHVATVGLFCFVFL